MKHLRVWDNDKGAYVYREVLEDEVAGAEAARLMGELVDLLASHPRAPVDPRAWRQLLIYAPKG